MLRVGWLWQVDLDEFTARLHQIALTKPAWVPKIRAVVVDTLAKRVGADGIETAAEIDLFADADTAMTHADAQLAAQPFTDEEAQQIFVLFDADASGTVDIDELVVFVKAIKGRDDINPAAVSEVWDKDNSGEVTCPDSRLR